MAQLAIDKGFMDDYSRLERSVQAAVKAALDKFAEHARAGLRLEKPQHPEDDRIRTIRVDLHWRCVVLAPAGGDTYYLLKVMEHDQASAFAASHTFTVNRDRVVFIDGSEELDRILRHPSAHWRTFLHPAQREIAYAPAFAGPVQVTGGAGTGKTVTATHRAVHLAKRALGQVPAGDGKTPVLLTTFTRNLADALQGQFGLLADVDDPITAAGIRAQVAILDIDRLAFEIVAKIRGINPAPIDGRELTDVCAVMVEKVGLPFSPAFLEREWRQVILGQGVRDEQAYLTCSRAGLGTPLGNAQRRQVWQAAQSLTAALRTMGRDTFPQLADEAAEVAQPQYRHIIVDEAQDLHPSQWRLLRALVQNGPDDLFIVGDPHQRIYDNHVSLAQLGIDVRGRSRRLTVNHRTTEEILAVAVPALGPGSFTGLDDCADTLDGYRSPLHGRRPRVIPASTREAELAALVRQVRAWLDEGIEPHAIGVAARAGDLWKAASEELLAAGILVATLSAGPTIDGVRLGSMHAMKGLEFQAVAVIGVSDGVVPAPDAVTPLAEDPRAHAQDRQRERCLLFVACTRARDHLYLSYSGTPSPFLG